MNCIIFDGMNFVCDILPLEKRQTYPILEIDFCTAIEESKNLKYSIKFDLGVLFFRSTALWSSLNLFGPLAFKGSCGARFRGRMVYTLNIMLYGRSTMEQRLQGFMASKKKWGWELYWVE